MLAESLVCKKLSKGESCEQIAQQLEESVDAVAKIKKLAEETVPKYDIGKILEKISE